MIGVDIVSIDRISRLKARWDGAFLSRFLSADEAMLARSDASIAGFWAAKEAASKALGTGIGAECGFFDIMISKNSRGAPIIKFTPEIYNKFDFKEAALSISHDGGFAIAAVILR